MCSSYANVVIYFSCIWWQAEDSLRQQKLKYLQLLALYSELKEMLIDYDIKKQEIHPGSNTAQVSLLYFLEEMGWNFHCRLVERGQNLMYF